MANRIVFQADRFRLIEVKSESRIPDDGSTIVFEKPVVTKSHHWEYKEGVDLLGVDRWLSVPPRSGSMVTEVLTAMLISGALKQSE